MINVLQPVDVALRASTALKAIVNTNIFQAGGRQAIDNDYPSLIYSLVTNGATYVWEGTGISEAFSSPAIQLDLYEKTNAGLATTLTVVDAIMVGLCYMRTFESTTYDNDNNRFRLITRYESTQI